MKYFINSSKRAVWLIPAALFLGCLATRMLFVAGYLEGWDSVNFALALQNFDVTAGQPHFPGYPVYIFISRIFLKWVGNEPLALTTTGALFSSLTILPLYALAKRMFSTQVGILASLLFIVNPMLWLQAEKAYSDAFGLFFIMTWAYLLYQSVSTLTMANTTAAKKEDRTGGALIQRLRSFSQNNALYFAGILLGLAMGIRLSYFPFLLTWLFIVIFLYRRIHNRGIQDSLYGLIFGVALWLIPLLTIVGTKSLGAAGLRHLRGHFYEWGGTLTASVDLFERLKMFFWDLLANGMGFWWPDTSSVRLITSVIVIVAVILYIRTAHFDFKQKFILATLLPYAFWVFAGQNLNSPRHFLPLLPMFLIVVAAGIWQGMERLSKTPIAVNTMRLSAGALLLGATAITSTGLVRLHKNTLPTRVQLVRYVLENFPAESTLIYCWNTKRLFDYYAPDFHLSSKLPEKARFRQTAANDVETVLVTSDHPAIEELKEDLVLVKTFTRNRYVHNWFHDLRLYELIY